MKTDIIKNYLNKILTFYLPNKAGYWNTITPCNVSSKPKELSRYYLDFSSKVNYPGKFSDNGIPLFFYAGKADIQHPTVIAQYAFGLFEKLFISKFSNKELKNKFLIQAEWFYKNQVDVKGGKGWYISIDYHFEYRLTNPWISAMAQGEAISVLTRAFLLTKDERYEKLAIDAIGPFEYEVQEGGLVNYFKSIPVYEECPTPHKPMAVLNGLIFSLYGLYDLFLLNKNSRAEMLFNTGIRSLIKLLPYFDIKHWTNYYLFDHPKNYYSSFTYHVLVTEQLKAIYFITGENTFLEYSERWENYSKNYLNKTRALFAKLIHSNKFSI